MAKPKYSRASDAIKLHIGEVAPSDAETFDEIVARSGALSNYTIDRELKRLRELGTLRKGRALRPAEYGGNKVVTVYWVEE